MGRWGSWTIGGALAGAWLVLACSALAQPEQGQWATRTQVVYDAASGTIARVAVKAWDPRPDRNLDFVWEPDAGQANAGLRPDGTIEGRGKLVWRVRGSASYDPRTVYSLYVGALREGRPHGRGRMEERDGGVLDGTWVEGRFTGEGMRLDARGDRYSGHFVDGLLEGHGRLARPNGEIFDGPFKAGRPHGAGTLRLPGGVAFASTWADGIEQGVRPPQALAAARLGGLLDAQGGGDAGKLDMAIAMEQRMNQQAQTSYASTVSETGIAIAPDDKLAAGIWNGTADVADSWQKWEVYYERDWTESFAFVRVDLDTTDGKRVGFDRIEVEVDRSRPFRKPMFALNSFAGCVGFSPYFALSDNGWGSVPNLTLNLAFAGQDRDGPHTRQFSHPVAGFETGTDVRLDAVLAQAGVDVDKLGTTRFPCEKPKDIKQCRADALAAVGLGELSDVVWWAHDADLDGEDDLVDDGAMADDVEAIFPDQDEYDKTLFVQAFGTIDYAWTDGDGTERRQSEPFQVPISLLTLERREMGAEASDDWGEPPASPRFIDVKFDVDRLGYSIDVPMRGNKSLSSYTARLRLSAAEASTHRFRVLAHMADGSVRRSPDVEFHYFRPRDYTTFYESRLETDTECYLQAGFYQGDDFQDDGEGGEFDQEP